MRDAAPILLEVSTHRRLVDGAPGLLDLRLTNPGQDTLYARIALHGDPVGDWASIEVIPPHGAVELTVRTRILPRGDYLCVARITTDGDGGAPITWVGQFDREVEAAAGSSLSYHVNISGGDGAVIDAEHLRVGHDGGTRVHRPGATYVPVPLRADPLAGAIARATLTDASRARTLHVLTGASLTIGRERASVDIAVPEQHHQVSRRHCLLCVTDGALWIEHVATTNTTRLNDAEVAGRAPVPGDAASRIVLGRQTTVELSPLRDAGVDDELSGHLVARGIGVTPPGGRGLGGWLLHVRNPESGRGTVHLWVLGAVRLGDIPEPPTPWTPLVLASIPELFQAELSSSGGIRSIAPLTDGGRVGPFSVESWRET